MREESRVLGENPRQVVGIDWYSGYIQHLKGSGQKRPN